MTTKICNHKLTIENIYECTLILSTIYGKRDEHNNPILYYGCPVHNEYLGCGLNCSHYRSMNKRL